MGYREWREMQAEKIGGPADAPKTGTVLSPKTEQILDLIAWAEEEMTAAGVRSTESVLNDQFGAEMYYRGVTHTLRRVLIELNAILPTEG